MDDWENLPGRLFVISGASGSGKSTLVRLALQAPGSEDPPLDLGDDASPRPGEEDGREYYFLSRQAFVEQREPRSVPRVR